MKIRTGFVSNSSSSSFIIEKKDVNELQLEKIRDHMNAAKKLGLETLTWCGEHDKWDIAEDDETISGKTSMDNFQICELFDAIGITDSMVTWSEY